MAKRLVISKRAQQDLANISLYVASIAGSQKRADAYVDRVVSSLRVLLTFPESSPLAAPERSSTMRKRTIDSLTVVFYRVTSTTVRIVSVKDARTDWPSTL